MKIEKINDNKIRCTLTREDLDSRHIKLSELAYGSDKAKLLFRDMMKQANYQFGFEADDMPLMIEAVPISTDSITLIISKVEYPEELDTRFSKFTDPEEYSGFISDNDSNPIQTANDILNLFREIDDKNKKKASGEDSEKAFVPFSDGKNISGAPTPSVPADIFKLFCFGKLDTVLRISKVLSVFKLGVNSLYLSSDKKDYYLILHKSDMSPEDFNRVCNILSEYSTQFSLNSASLAFFEEHQRSIIKDDALQKLAAL
ncbi:MAG: adaptor protein MecA [Lachnospiraceae bacterium]|nr:adaptor protein MecA [Lachnospiraceae bacterium]